MPRPARAGQRGMPAQKGLSGTGTFAPAVRKHLEGVNSYFIFIAMSVG